MKLLKLVLMALLSIPFSQGTYAQASPKNDNKKQGNVQVSVSGIIRDAETNSPVKDVTISIEGKKAIGVSKEDGSFSVSVTKGSTLVFTMVSFASQRMLVNESVQNKPIMLARESKELENVVVTALGISRKQKALGYSVQSISEADLNDARSNNWSSALSGKVAGLNLISAGSGPLNSTRISLRGDASMNPDGNNALIVVDGIPKNSTMTSSGVNNAYGAGSGNDIPIDFGNGISDIITLMILKASPY